MQSPDYMPLGSVCLIKGSDKKLMIIERGVLVCEDKSSEKFVLYDYGACFYPEGLVGDRVLFFNHDVVEDVIWMGYASSESDAFVEKIKEYISGIDIPKGKPSPLAIVKEEGGGVDVRSRHA